MIVGMGFDMVEISRVDKLIGAKGDRAIARLFTDAEAAYAMRRAHPCVHLAARIAAKEAAYKALSGTASARSIAWREMEVVSGTDGRPSLIFHGRAAERASELSVSRIWLTLSHTELTAGAVVVLEGERTTRKQETESTQQ
jgi:holo-[acyl-carrier protein] synthase